MNLKAIETVYNGYRFRSRLEARWAVFLDTLKIPYEYEKEGYELPSGWYLPDFWLPSLNLWMEVKPTDPSDLEQRKCHELTKASGHSMILMYGEIPYPHPDSHMWGGEIPYSDFPYGSGQMFCPEGGDNPYWFCDCHKCGEVGIEFDGRGARIDCGCSHQECGNGDKCYSAHSPQMMRAYAAARQARFEHGESG